MNKAYKYDMTIALRMMNRIIAEGKKAPEDAKKELEAVKADTEHSEMWKAKRIADINMACDKKLRELGSYIRPLTNKVFTLLDAMSAEFNYADPVLQSALHTIEIAGKNLPFEVQNKIIDSFKGDPIALKMIRTVFRKYELPDTSFDLLLKPFDSIEREIVNSAADTFEAYAMTEDVTPQWKPTEYMGHLRRVTDALGIDTSVNPYAVEIQKLGESTDNPKVAARIRLFNQVYGEALENDEESAILTAKSKLATGFEV